MSKYVHPFPVIDAAAQYTDANLEPVAGIQWTCFDYLVRTVMDQVPTKHHEAFIDNVTRPKFKPNKNNGEHNE